MKAILLRNAEILQSSTVFPLANFPVRENEELLTTLLRKRLIPEIENEEEEFKQNYSAEEIAKTLDVVGTDISLDFPTLLADQQAFVAWAIEQINEIKEDRDLEAMFTNEEEEEKEKAWDKDTELNMAETKSEVPKSIPLSVMQLNAFMNTGRALT